MPLGQEKAGRPRVLLRRHVIELKEDTRDWIEGLSADLLNKQSAFPKTRLAGAAITAAGVFMLTVITAAIVKGAITAVVGFTAQFALTTVGFFSGLLGKKGVPTDIEEALPGKVMEEVEKRLPGVKVLAVSLGMTAGGMVLAGQNPGAVLSGIGDIIDGLIPG